MTEEGRTQDSGNRRFCIFVGLLFAAALLVGALFAAGVYLQSGMKIVPSSEGETKTFGKDIDITKRHDTAWQEATTDLKAWMKDEEDNCATCDMLYKTLHDKLDVTEGMKTLLKQSCTDCPGEDHVRYLWE